MFWEVSNVANQWVSRFNCLIVYLMLLFLSKKKVYI